eukprot:3565690-Heterocapsa_arctica.AAC.1
MRSSCPKRLVPHAARPVPCAVLGAPAASFPAAAAPASSAIRLPPVLFPSSASAAAGSPRVKASAKVMRYGMMWKVSL